jgi:hypothetical protein
MTHSLISSLFNRVGGVGERQTARTAGLSMSRVQHCISFQAPKLEDREGGKKKQDGRERRRNLAVPAEATHMPYLAE